MAAPLRGFDVSHYQGSVDWAALKTAHSIVFGFVKATEGVTWVDDQFASNWTKLASSDLVRGAYHFGHPDTNPVDQADHFLDVVGAVSGFDKLILDLEHGDGLSQADVNGWARSYAARVYDQTGRWPIVYSGKAYFENRTADGWNEIFGGWWMPRYPTTSAVSVWPSVFNPVPPSPNSWGALSKWWQFSANFTSGQGQFDANVFDGTLAELQTLGTEDTGMLPCVKGDGPAMPKGDVVAFWQEALRDLGYYTGAFTRVYDAATEQAVNDFRAANGWGPATRITPTTAMTIFEKKFAIPGPKGDKGDPGADSTVPGPIGPEGPAGKTPTKVTVQLDANVTEVL